jgi:hypothetical protein
MFTKVKQYDRSRLMMPAIDLRMPVLNSIHLEVCDLMKIINKKLIPSESYAILSQGSERNPTCSQIFHSDFDLNESNIAKSGKSIIMRRETNCELRHCLKDSNKKSRWR